MGFLGGALVSTVITKPTGSVDSQQNSIQPIIGSLIEAAGPNGSCLRALCVYSEREAGSVYLGTSSESDAEVHNLGENRSRWDSRKMLKKRELLVSSAAAEFGSSTAARLGTRSAAGRMCDCWRLLEPGGRGAVFPPRRAAPSDPLAAAAAASAGSLITAEQTDQNPLRVAAERPCSSGGSGRPQPASWSLLGRLPRCFWS